MTEITQAMERVRKFFRARPRLNRTEFAKRAGLHRNSLYGMHKSWNPRAETLERCLVTIGEIEDEEQRSKGRPRRVTPAVALPA